MKGLDLRKFQKVSSDDAMTRLKHVDGHEIRIAHAKLNEKMRGELEKLPMHMAEGGASGSWDDEESQPKPSQTPAPSQTPPPVSININAQPQQQSQAPEPHPLPPPQPVQQQPMPQETQRAPKPTLAPVQKPAQALAQAPKQQAADMAPPPAPEDAVQVGQQAPQAMVQPMQPPPVQEELMQEQKAWEHDLQNGHITPKTYSDLYAKKSTLGKIGTLFGLLVGGAGAGLSHQPNALLEMMNREINNDLEAQKQSKGNAQNFLRINQQDMLNRAQIAQMERQAPLTEAQTKQLKAETDIKAYTLAQAQMLQTSYHNLVQNVDRMPEGPSKEAAKQQLGIIYSKIGDKINNINDQAAGAIHYSNMLFGNQNHGADPEQEFQKKTQGMRMLGPQGEARAKDLEDKHVPGLSGQASIPIPHDDRNRIEAMNVLDNKVRDVLDFAKQHAGTLNPQTLARGKQKAEELIAFYNKSVDNLGMTEGRLGWLEKQIKDDPTSVFKQIMGNNERLREIRDSNVGRRDILTKKYGLPDQKSSVPDEGAEVERLAGNGKIAVFDSKTKKFLRWK